MDVKSSAPIIAFASLLYCFRFSAAMAADDSTFVPSNPPEMRRLAGTNSPAHQAAKYFMRGVNLGNYLESPRNAGWGVTVSAEEFQIMKREGFDHVRIPVRWSDYMEETGGYGVGIRPVPVNNLQSTPSSPPTANATPATTPQPVAPTPPSAALVQPKIQPTHPAT